MSELSYPQQQFAVTVIVAALWLAIELIPARWWPRHRAATRRAARYVGGTVLVTFTMIHLRRQVGDATKPELWAVFAAAVVGACLLLRQREFLRRFVPRAGPDELGVLRCVIGLTLTFFVVRDDVVSTSLIPANVLRKYGMVWDLHAKLGDARWLLDIRDLAWLRVVYWTALISGITTTLGLLSRVSVPVLCVSFTLSYHALASYSHFFHVGLVPLLILYVLVFFPTGASFSIDARLRRWRGKPPIDAPPEVWVWGVYSAWLLYGLAYWAAGASKLSQPHFWGMQTLRRYVVRDSDILLEFDFDLAQRLVAWNLDEWVFGPAAVMVLLVEVCAIWVLFSARARTWFPPILVGFHVGVLVLQGIAFFDLMLLPLAFVPARSYRRVAARLRLPVADERPKPSIEAVVERRRHNLARVLVVASLPGLVLTGWLYRLERFPLLTRWGMFESATAVETIKFYRLYAVYEDGSRARTDLTKEIRALNNTRFRDTINWMVSPAQPSTRKFMLLRIQALVNAAGAIYNEGRPAGERVVQYELENVVWELEKDRDNPQHGVTVATVVFVVGDKRHPEIPALNRKIKRELAKRKREQQKSR